MRRQRYRLCTYITPESWLVRRAGDRFSAAGLREELFGCFLGPKPVHEGCACASPHEDLDRWAEMCYYYCYCMCLPACPKVLLVRLSSGCISEGRPREFRRRRACHDRPAVPQRNAGLSQQTAVSFRWQTTSEAALCKLNGLEQQKRPASTAMLLQIRLQSAPRAAVRCCAGVRLQATGVVEQRASRQMQA